MRMVAFAAALAFHLTVCAEESKWEKEPVTVLGIRLGAPLSEIQVPKCRGLVHATSKELCISRIGPPDEDELFSIFGLPFKDIRVSGTLFSYQGKTSSIHLVLPHDDASRMLDVLIERYGMPSKEDKSDLTTVGGGVFTSKTLSWLGTQTTITFFERSGRIDKTLVAFSNIEMGRIRMDAEEQKKKKAASEL